MEDHVILLDHLQEEFGENYCVTFVGTLAACRARCGGTFEDGGVAWQRVKWRPVKVSSCVMRDWNNRAFTGMVARMERKA